MPNKNNFQKKKPLKSKGPSFIYSSIVWVSALSMILIFSMHNYAQLLVLYDHHTDPIVSPEALPTSKEYKQLSLCKNRVLAKSEFAIVTHHEYDEPLGALGNSILSQKMNVDMALKAFNALKPKTRERVLAILPLVLTWK